MRKVAIVERVKLVVAQILVPTLGKEWRRCRKTQKIIIKLRQRPPSVQRILGFVEIYPVG